MKPSVIAMSAVVVLGLAASANAQTAEQINSTAVSTRRAWCANQVAVCTNVCSQKTQQNLCNFNNLQFVCVCGNGTRLDFSNSDVDLTIPFFICTNFQWQPCVRACPAGDQPCQDKCNSQYQCGRVKPNPNPTVTITVAPEEPTNKPATGPVSIDNNAAMSGMAKGAAAVVAAVLGSAAVAFL